MNKKTHFLVLPLAVFIGLGVSVFSEISTANEKDGWISVFNGKNLDGWKSNEEVSGCFKVEAGALKVSCGRAHLFYVGPGGADGTVKFKDFELRAKVKSTAGSNSGIFFHTRYQERGWLSSGYEAQINNHENTPKRTGSLFGVVDVTADKFAVLKDGEWFDYAIRVLGKRVVLRVNGKVTADFTEPDGWNPSKLFKDFPGRRLSEGTFAIQGHDSRSTVYYRDMLVKRL